VAYSKWKPRGSFECHKVLSPWNPCLIFLCIVRKKKSKLIFTIFARVLPWGRRVLLCFFFFQACSYCPWVFDSSSLGKWVSSFILDLILLHSLVLASLITWNCHFVLFMKGNFENWTFFILLQDFVNSSRGKGGLSISWTICLLNFLEHVILKFSSLLPCLESVCWATLLEFFMPKMSSLHVKT